MNCWDYLKDIYSFMVAIVKECVKLITDKKRSREKSLQITAEKLMEKGTGHLNLSYNIFS